MTTTKSSEYQDVPLTENVTSPTSQQTTTTDEGGSTRGRTASTGSGAKARHHSGSSRGRKSSFKEVTDSLGGSLRRSISRAESDGVIELKPKMNLVNGITVIVGSVIGSGIFVSPKGVLVNTGSVGLSIIVWIVAGLYSMIGAYCYAELGCMITKSGADYAYIMESFGSFVAFLRLWVECMIVRPCSQAIVALTFSFYVLRPIYPDCEPPDDAVRYLAFICIGELM